MFFGSVRYSEDIDLDVVPIKRRAVKKALLDIMKSSPFMRRLRTLGIQELRIGTNEVSKDTETTLRLGRQVVVGGVPYATSIEISFRTPHAADGRETVPIDQRLADRYLELGTIVRVPHYVRTAAISQKLTALAYRTAVQARDVFDLCWLMQHELDPAERDHIAERVDAVTLRKASTRAMEMPFEEYRDQVIEYLDPSEAQAFASESDWVSQQLQVVALVADLLGRQAHEET